jgi:uncharacterized caspase-like protein/lipoprotein NlpI
MRKKLLLLFLFSLMIFSTVGMRQERKLGVIGKDAQGDFKGNKWAIIIGISSYKYLPTAIHLKYAHRDAELFYDFITSPQGGGFSDNHIQLLLNHQATKMNIETALGDFLVRQTSPEDIVYIYFAGHGYVDENQRPYLIAYDTEPDKLFATAIKIDDVNQLIYSDIKARHIILITDACHSGYIGAAGTRAGIGQNLINRFMNEISRAKDSLFNLSASTSMELSHEDARWGNGHGVFTYYLVKGLKGEADSNADGLVNASEAFRYVLNNVSEATSDKQHPEAKGRYDSELTLAVISPEAITTAPPKPSEPEISNEDLHDKRKRLEELEKPKEIAGNAQFFLDRGWDYLKKGLHEQAITDYSSVIEINPEGIEAYIYRGWLYYLESQYDQAIADFSRAIDIKPSWDAYSFRGRVYMIKELYDQAIDDFASAIELCAKADDSFVDILKQNAYMMRTASYNMKKLYDKAKADFEIAQKIYKKLPKPPIPIGFYAGLEKDKNKTNSLFIYTIQINTPKALLVFIQDYPFSPQIAEAVKKLKELVKADDEMYSSIMKWKIERGWLGVQISEVDDRIAKKFKLSKAEGLLINKVEKDSPAEKAGLKREDIILKYQGKNIESMPQLQIMIATTKPGSEAELLILRDGKKVLIKVEIGELKLKLP